MVLTRQASALVLARMRAHSWRPVATRRSGVSAVLSLGDTEGGLLSKSLLDGKHKVINLRPAGRRQEGHGGPAGLFGEEIPPSLRRVSGGNGLIRLALAPK